MQYITPIGPHDGDTWEKLCQVCLKLKYNGDYIEVRASPGDYGLDGFTTEGSAYQCYCPERECSDDDLYVSQRDKVTRDIKKLKKFEIKITELLNGVRLKRWYLLTPKITRHDLLFHCNEKANLVKSLNLPFIDSDFKIVPLDVEYLSKEIPSALSLLDYMSDPNSIQQRIESRGSDVSEADINSYKQDLKYSDYTKNAYRKHEIRYTVANPGGNDYSTRIVDQVDRTIENLLLGDNILKEWEILFQDQLDKFFQVMGILEREVADLCDIPTNDPEKRYREIKELVETTINREFIAFSTVTKKNLSMRVVADWLLRCPLNFE